MISTDLNESKPNVSKLHNLPLSALRDLRNTERNNVADAKQALAEVETEILSRCSELLKKTRQVATKFDGVIGFEMDGMELKATAAKKITWDQSELKKIFGTLESRGAPPTEYIDIKLGVSEAKFKSWPTAIQKLFEPARTLKLGEERIEFVEAESGE